MPQSPLGSAASLAPRDGLDAVAVLRLIADEGARVLSDVRFDADVPDALLYRLSANLAFVFLTPGTFLAAMKTAT